MTETTVHLITGLSGSGKTTAARALEDAGFFVVDNLPLPLLPQCLAMTSQTLKDRPLVVVVDVRNRAFLDDVETVLRKVETDGFHLKILFFSASDQTLVRRFSETRRRPPLMEEGSVEAGIQAERALLSLLRQSADKVFDSSGLTPQKLREGVLSYIQGTTRVWPLAVHVESFGFRYGVPTNADLVFDVRFMPNPFYLDALREKTGLDREVQEYVLAQKECQTFIEHTRNLLQFLLPQYRKEGKNHLTIAFGCTGGRHRSVTLAETIGPLLEMEGVEVHIGHRDVEKG